MDESNGTIGYNLYVQRGLVHLQFIHHVPDNMLTLVSVKKNAVPAIQFTNNAQTFQGSMWTQPSSSMNFVKNGVDIQGPMAIGAFDATFNNASFQPLPVIKNMPVGAPLPPNTGVTVGPLIVTK